MSVHVRSLENENFEVSLGQNYKGKTIFDLKQEIYKMTSVIPERQKIFKRNSVLENHITIDKYKGSTVDVLNYPPIENRNCYFEDPIFSEELRNFVKIQRKEYFYGDVKFYGNLEKIVFASINGPLVDILEFIDPLELVLSTMYVCKHFYDCTMKMLSRGFNMTEDHYFLIFNPNSRISESLFLKFAKTVNHKTFYVHLDVPLYSKKKKEQSFDIFESCISKGFLKSLKKLQRIYNVDLGKKKDILFFSYTQCLNNIFLKEEDIIRTIEYLIDNFDGFNILHEEICAFILGFCKEEFFFKLLESKKATGKKEIIGLFRRYYDDVFLNNRGDSQKKY